MRLSVQGSSMPFRTGGTVVLCLQHSNFCVGLHGHAAPALFLVVARFVAHGDLLFQDSTPQLAIRMLALGAVHCPGVVLEDTPYRMEQTVDCQDGGGQGRAVLTL